MRNGIAATLVLALLAGSAYAQTPSGEQIVQQGNGNGATACASCHGKDGAGNEKAGYPRLSGLNADYIAAQLHNFRSGKRNNPVMQPIAKALSEDEVPAVAKYYAGQTSDVQPPKVKDEQVLKQGEHLATRGDWGDTIPACMACHGPGGNGVGTTFPALAGQHASYITAQIEAWQNGKRKGDPNQLMTTVAKRLSKAQVEAVAAYFASLKPGQ